MSQLSDFIGGVSQVATGDKPLQVSVGIDTQSATFLGIAILVAVTIGVFIGTKAAKI